MRLAMAAISVFCAFATISPSLAADHRFDAHGSMQCSTCHVSARPTFGEGKQLRAGQTRLCSSCHRGSIEASHPVGSRPGRKLPAEFPLDDTGRVTCTTCHDLHQGTRGLLRVAKSGVEFCLSCHNNAFFDRMADKGVSITMSGHLNAGTEGLFKVSPYSFQCATCHQDKMTDHSRQNGLTQVASGGNHPVGTEYSKASDFGGYRAAAFIDPDVLMPDGRLSCVSCHRPYAARHGAPPRTRRGLCATCHAL
jgi:predicted CXXCH cytochrome family protein